MKVREFHRTMFEHEARLKYAKSGVLVFLESPSFGALRAICEAFREEFGVDADGIKIEASDGFIRLVVPMVTEPTSAENRSGSSQEITGADGSEEEAEGPRGWIRLTDRVFYRVEDGVLRLANNRNPILSIDLDVLKELYRKLPEEFETEDLERVAREMNLDNVARFASYIMRFFADRAEFGGELLKIGRKLRFTKDNASVREENRKKLMLEREVIGTPWSARG